MRNMSPVRRGREGQCRAGRGKFTDQGPAHARAQRLGATKGVTKTMRKDVLRNLVALSRESLVSWTEGASRARTDRTDGGASTN